MENQPKANPLAKYFRQPSIYIKLPSKGKFWQDNALELPVTGEVPIYPMTTKDEVTLRTPDALMNGAGIVDIINSCCPAIKDAWKMPSIDVDAVLIAIRIASYGHQMDVETTCPQCQGENTHAIDLRVSLASIQSPDYSQKVDLGHIKVKLKPQIYFGVNKANMIDYEEQRMLRALEAPDVDPELRAQEINQSMARLVDIALDTVTNSTEYIETEDGTVVNDPEFIKEFYVNAEGAVIKAVQKQLSDFNAAGGVQPQAAPCTHCGTEYKIPLLFDYANFFGVGS
jgi:hypothetical protein